MAGLGRERDACKGIGGLNGTAFGDGGLEVGLGVLDMEWDLERSAA